MPADKSQLTINQARSLQGSLQGRKDMLGYGISYLVLKIVIGCIPFFLKWEEIVVVGGTKNFYQ